MSPPQSLELAAVDSLLWTQPDSALTRLISCYDTVDDRHFANLLLAELLYKNYYEQTNRTELLKAVAYYDSVSCPFLAARAHYINGVGYYERDSVVSACKEYLQALEIMEEHFAETELVGEKAQFMALTYNRLGDLFSGQFMMESAIECYESALFYCEIEPTSPNGVSSILYRIGVLYDEKEETEKAKSYYEQAMERLKTTDNLLFRDIVSSKAIANYQLGEESTQVLGELRQIITHADNENELLHRFVTIGAVFIEEGIYDSALLYFVPVFQKQIDIASNIRVAESLQIIYDSLGNKEKADECVRFLASHKKPEGECKALVSKLDDMFKNFQHKKHERQAAKEKQTAIWKISKMLFFVLVLAVVILIVAMKQNKQLEKEKKARQRDKERHWQKLRQREEQVRTLEDALNHQCTEAELRREAFMKEDICIRINDNVRSQDITARNSSWKNVPFTTEDATALKEAVLKHYANFEAFLLSKYPKMSHEDLQLCQLYLLGLDERQIAVLQCKTYSAIKKRAKVLKDYLGINESLSAFILKF